MATLFTVPEENTGPNSTDEYLFGWHPAEGIVSVWADREGRAIVWQRDGSRLLRHRTHFRPWLLARDLEDIAHLGAAHAEEGASRHESAAVTFRVLDGDEGRYRFLLSAASGRRLERAVLEGAGRRLGQTVRSLYDLGNAYYWVGPVEQYLMQTGQVYFKGLQYDDLHRLQFDLETTALDPHRGRIFMVAVRDSRGLAITLEAPSPADESRLIAELCDLIRERDPDVIENHNLFGFDLPFLEYRAKVLGIPLPLGRAPGPPHLESYAERPGGRRVRYTLAGRELIDTLDAVRRHDFVVRDLPSHRLKDVARAFGLAAADRVYIEGGDIVETYREQPERVRQYALDDVAEVDALSRRLMGPAFALAAMAPRRYERVAAAGPAMGILEPMLVRAYLRAGAALPRPGAARGDAAGPHAGGAVHLFATGVAEQVVKADIASLYPSLMCAYQIGPAPDRLGVLLGIVGRLTGLRLAHKDALRDAQPYSSAWGYHNAMQAAMKLIINSAYGYMGAGEMALFADRAAADEVTRRGREVLGQVVEALAAHGMALIEADTDGVYFAAPKGWTEAQERAVVAEVAGRLPDGLRLEYEGRYRAMFSHEIKNYALLTYDDELIVRGVALRSSRAEPFGEEFLRRALYKLLTGDMAGIREAFLATVAALRERRLPAAAVATRVRLSKAPDAYMASREKNREQAYEALLAAGRSEWTVGERVRCYRASGGRPVWLPDEGDDPGTGRSAEEIDRREPPRPAPDYDVDHYVAALVTSYAARLRKALAPADFEQLFRLDGQLGLFDRPLDAIEPIRIEVPRGADISTQ